MPMKTDTLLKSRNNILTIKPEMTPQQSTIDFILAFAAAYEVPRMKPEMPGYILN